MSLQQTLRSPTTVISQTATVANTEVVGGDTELDNSTNKDVAAVATLAIPNTFGGTPDGPIDLYMVRGEADGTTDNTALGYAALDTTDNQTDPEYAEYCGSFFPNVDEAYRDAITISLLGVLKAKFYIRNSTGQNLVYSDTAITLSIAGIQLADA